MAIPAYIKPERITLKNHPELDERWLQDRIAEDPSILGLGDVILKDRERIQPHAGRLDLLLQDTETGRRYEVELQLGRTDETHIIRTVEYWDIERRRYPQYDHCAVIVAEDITSRFLNVIGLFNGSVPLVAIQMQALSIGDKVALAFTTVMDEMTRGLVEEDEDVEITDRPYWEQRGTPLTVSMADQLLDLIREFAPGLEFKYNKAYIGMSRDGHTNNFVSFQPKKKSLNLLIKLKQSDDIENQIEESGLDTMDYDKRFGNYRLKLTAQDPKKHSDVLKRLMSLAYENRNS